MNDLLLLKGTYSQKDNPKGFGTRNLRKGKSVTIEHMRKLLSELEVAFVFWNEQKLLPGALLSLEYKTITPKSSRVKRFFAKGTKITSNSSIVGAKFATDGDIRHIITHFVDLNVLSYTIKNLSIAITNFEREFGESISYDDIEKIHTTKMDFVNIDRSQFVDYIVDSSHLVRIFIDDEVDASDGKSIVTIYNTNTDTITLMDKLGIKITRGDLIDDTTILLDPDSLFLLQQKAPYLISMATTDLSLIDKDDFADHATTGIATIPKPTNEPIVGVIDTMFDTRVYFAEWVEFKNMLDPSIPIDEKDKVHGTSISSIIVDGGTINPNLDDGCGRFRVRHFGVTKATKFSSFTILKLIQEIVASNRDIKVWNLSLGSNLEVNKNSISPEAAILDKIQHEYDVIFIVAGTNNRNPSDLKRLGAPADSINSLVVNSVKFDNSPASYTRVGPVLSFFNKPDISYYGGDASEKIKVCTANGEELATGTSIAAPWITRKMAYLIYILGLNRESAKALLIDAAAGWSKNDQPSTKIGYGVVPKRIEDIVKSKDSEIKFVLSGAAASYSTYNYNIPVPLDKSGYPYIARATLCYFPHCSRKQGIDYTSTEFNLKFGRVETSGIKSINNDTQDNPESYLYEGTARKYFRKWDNVKHIREFFTGKNRVKKTNQSKMWGIEITTKERVEEKHGKGINFGIVVTIREINGINRIQEFIHQCSLRGWLVNKINVEQRVDIYQRAEEKIVFED